MLGLPLPWTKCLARFWALVCSMSKIRWLCWPHRLALVGLFCAVPSFSGSEMIWLDPLVGLSWCCCSLWNEWDLHVYAFCRNECFPHVRRAVVLQTDSPYWARRFFIVVQYWRGLWAAFCFTCCFAVFVVSPLCFQKALPFCELRFAFCSKDLLPSVIKSDLWANWGKPCLWL